MTTATTASCSATQPSAFSANAAKLELLAQKSGSRELSITHSGAKTDSLVNGRFSLKREFDGVLVHACNMEEQRSASISCEQSAELTFGILLEGKVTFGHNGELGTLDAEESAQGWATNTTRTATWQRQLNAKQQVHKLVVAVSPHWIKQNLLQGKPPIFFSRFINTHLARTHWRASGELVRMAKSVMSSHNDTPSQALHFHASVLAFIAQAIDDLEGSQNILSYFNGQPSPTKGANNQALKIKQYLEAHIQQLIPGQQIQLTTVAQELGMSVSKLQRIAKSHFGCTVAEYIRTRRLEIARYEIEQNQLSIGEAAFIAGYNHRSNFSKAFKQYFNLCPGSLIQK